MPATVATGHHHRPTTKTAHKPFKSRKATKSQLRDEAKGKVPHERGSRKTPYQQAMSKIDRRNRNKQLQQEKHKLHQREASVFAGRDGAPRNIALIPLCADSDAAAAIRKLNGSLDIEADVSEGCFRVPVDRFKQKLQYMPLQRDLSACLDAARAADFVVMVLSANEEVDELGELILRSVESQGLSTLFTVVQGLDKIESAKQRFSVVASLKSYMMHFHPEQDKLYSLDNKQECSNLMRSLCSTTPRGIRWRDERSWMLVEDAKLPQTDSELTVLTGVVRGKGLKADRLVQVGDWGTFQIEKITRAPLAAKKERQGDGMDVDEGAEEILDLPGEGRDELADLAPEEVVMDDANLDAMSTMTACKKGVLLDDHHYFSEDEPEEKKRPKRVPKGTSKYQSAWYLGDDNLSDEGSDLDDYEMREPEKEEAARPEDGLEGLHDAAMTDGAPSEYPASEMVVEPNEDQDARELEAFRAKKRDEAQDDKEFPDEMELQPHVHARERLAKYRGLKSLRTSPWLEDEDRGYEPDEWRRLLHIPNHLSSRAQATREALVGGVVPGIRVHVYVKDVPSSMQVSHSPGRPLVLFSLLRHEHKRTAVNFLVNLSSDHTTSIRSKEELIMQCGPRRFVINPLFSQGGSTPNDVHKYCRYLHPGQSAVATFMGPLTWGAVPALLFRRSKPDDKKLNADGQEEYRGPTLPLALIGTGTALPSSTSRVIAKRVILTGHPYHIHKKVVTIRYMFFNREDVEWFKALPLWTRRGRSGYIKETLGTHGYFKATFDGRVNPQDAIGVSLYKRVWPRNAGALCGPLLGQEEGPKQEVTDNVVV